MTRRLKRGADVVVAEVNAADAEMDEDEDEEGADVDDGQENEEEAEIDDAEEVEVGAGVEGPWPQGNIVQ